MNVLSPFSFAKLIKIFLPGFILVGGLVLLVDIFYQSLCPGAAGLLVRMLHEPTSTNVVLLTVPVSLIAGLILSSFVWRFWNTRFRNRVAEDFKATYEGEILEALHQALPFHFCRSLTESFSPELELSPSQFAEQDIAPEYFYLPFMNLDHLMYLHESYFSWCEFNNNCAIALCIFVPISSLYVVLTAWVFNPSAMTLGSKIVLTICCVAFLVGGVLLCRFLTRLAYDNLLRYYKRRNDLIIGSLCFQYGVGGKGDLDS